MIALQKCTPMECKNNASCDFCFTEKQFLEYVRICDFMSKWKMWASVLVCSVFFIMVFGSISYFIMHSIETFIGITALFWLFLLILSICLIRREPPLWFTPIPKSRPIELYGKALGIFPFPTEAKMLFRLQDGRIYLITPDGGIEAPLQDVRWVRKAGDLVIIGCLDDSKSIIDPFSTGNVNFYRAIPGIAFLASKLEGMDPEELIALLEGCARQHRRNYFWDWQPVGGQ